MNSKKLAVRDVRHISQNKGPNLFGQFLKTTLNKIFFEVWLDVYLVTGSWASRRKQEGSDCFSVNQKWADFFPPSRPEP